MIVGIIFLILAISEIINAQTYISPFLAIDGATYGHRYEDFVATRRYATSPAYGLSIEHRLSDQWSFGFQGHFSRKFLPYQKSLWSETVGLFRSSHKVRLDNYSISLQAFHYFSEQFRVGIGPSMLNYGNHHVRLNNTDHYFKASYPSDTEYGGLLQLGYAVNNFQFNLAYHRHFRKEDRSRKGYSSILQFSLGYLIMVRKNKK